MKRIFEKSNGSALLVALILMGVLMTLSLGVSDLIIRAVSDNRTLIDTAQAWYAAESGVEKALQNFADNPPGFENEKLGTVNFSDSAHYSYDLLAAASQIPPLTAAMANDEKETYASLRLNESAIIPLFRGTDPADSVREFRVDFYVPVEIRTDFHDGAENILENLDLLRWKIFGISKQENRQMEVLNEFSPMKEGKVTSLEPTCIGTSTDCYNGGRFYQRNVDGSFSLWGLPLIPGPSDKPMGYFIETFLQNHRQNFLVLTNAINTDLFPETFLPEEKVKRAIIRYRVLQLDETEKKKMTMPYATITSDGFSGSAKQSLDVKIARETFLPVFNYALYRTVDK